GKDSQQFVSSSAFIQWLNQRLNNRYCAVVRTRISPRFEEVSSRHVPVRPLRGLVLVLAQVNNTIFDFLQSLGTQFQIDRRVVNRISADDDEQVHRSRIDVKE